MADIDLEQAKGGGEKAFDLLKTLAADELHQSAVDFPDGLFMDEEKSWRFHDTKKKKQTLYKWFVSLESVLLRV